MAETQTTQAEGTRVVRHLALGGGGLGGQSAGGPGGRERVGRKLPAVGGDERGAHHAGGLRVRPVGSDHRAQCAVTAGAVVRYGLGAWWETSLLIDASVVFVGFSMWLVVAAQDWLWVSVVVFMVMVSSLIHIVRLLVLRRHDLTCPSWVAVLATVTFGLYLGWSSVAVFANVAAALISSGVSASTVWWQFVALVAAGIFVLGLTRLFRATPGLCGGFVMGVGGDRDRSRSAEQHRVVGDGGGGRGARGGGGGVGVLRTAPRQLSALATLDVVGRVDVRRSAAIRTAVTGYSTRSL